MNFELKAHTSAHWPDARELFGMFQFSGAGFHIWSTKKPGINEDGSVDLSGLRLRSSPLYRAFFEALDATIVVQGASEVYTSLERGVVDGTGYPVTGLRDYGWDKFLKYRIDPGFYINAVRTILAGVMALDRKLEVSTDNTGVAVGGS